MIGKGITVLEILDMTPSQWSELHPRLVSILSSDPCTWVIDFSTESGAIVPYEMFAGQKRVRVVGDAGDRDWLLHLCALLEKWLESPDVQWDEYKRPFNINHRLTLQKRYHGDFIVAIVIREWYTGSGCIVPGFT